MYYLKMGLGKLKASDLVSKSSTIETKMDGNANFPTPDPAIADVTAQRLDLEALISKAKNGDREQIASRGKSYAKLHALLRKLANYVSHQADGDQEVILSSGFEVRKQREPMSPILRPENFSVQRQQRTGEVKLRWKTVRGAVSYNVEMTTTDPSDPNTTWESLPPVTRITDTKTGLTPGVNYWFRMRAVGRKEISAYSNVELIMAA